jgi:hypothetical protein
MSHTFKVGETYFHYNPDLSGTVTVSWETDGKESKFYIPGFAMHGFIEEIVKRATIEALDESRTAYTPEGVPRYHELLEEIRQIHIDKNKAYSTGDDKMGNFHRSRRLGPKPGLLPSLGILNRMQDKWSRVESLSQGVPDVVNESMEDTLKDLANYALLAIICLEEEREERNAAQS